MPHRRLFSIPLGYDREENAACGEVNEEDVQEALTLLPLREQRVLRSRYFNERKPTPYAMIGREEGLSGERIRQLEQRAINRLRLLLERD